MSRTATPAVGDATFGAERIAPGADGEVVRLADVVRWLMNKEQTVRVDAVEQWLLPMLEAKSPELYLLQQGGFGRSIEGMEWFATGSGDPGQQGWRSHEGRLHRRMATSCGEGLRGAVAWLRGVWACEKNADDVLDRAVTRGARLAIRKADARVFWGWLPAGEAADAAASSQTLAGADGEVWSGERLKKRRDELIGMGVKKHMKQLTLESGLPDRKIRHLIASAEEAEISAPIWQGLKKKGDKVTPIAGSRKSAPAVQATTRSRAAGKKNKVR